MEADLQELWTSGLLLDGVIALTLIELLALQAFRWRTGRGLAGRDYLLNLASGLFLMLAIRTVLHGSNWLLTLLCLSAAGICHVLDLWRRWQRTHRWG
ncbi:MAG: hypothetical protein V4731_08060 [Pseudomonadota bacterium]